MNAMRWMNAACWPMVIVSTALAILSFAACVWPAGIGWTVSACAWTCNAIDGAFDDDEEEYEG